MPELIYTYNDYAVFFLRVALGIILLAHGWPKCKSIKITAANFGAMGFKPGAFWAPVVAIVETVGGVAFIAGVFTQLAALFVVAEFLVIIVWKMAKKSPLVGGLELDLLILGAAAMLLTMDPGAFTVLDAIIPSP